MLEDSWENLALTTGHSTAFMEPPFKCTNEGWGEFEMTIDLFTTEKGGKQSIVHDLNFAAPQYENIHTLSFKNPSQALQQILRETGPLPSDEERKLKKGAAAGTGGGDGGKKKKTFDVEKMADGLVRLGEDDLLQVIQMIHDHKDDNTYVQNNIDAGEFSVDLYTLPDALLKMLWDFLVRFYLLNLVDSLLTWWIAQAGCRHRLSSRAAVTCAYSTASGVWRWGREGSWGNRKSIGWMVPSSSFRGDCRLAVSSDGFARGIVHYGGWDGVHY